MTTFDTSSFAGSTSDEIAAEFLGVQPLSGAPNSRQPDYANAFRAWASAIGGAHVLHDAVTCADYSKTTLPRGTQPAGVVRPRSRDEVRQVVQIAHRFGVPLHAISRGKNWGYGDACAPTDGQVIVELTRMNRVREVNVELGYAVIEAGVSQGQMYEYLRDNEIPLLLDATGAGPDASIVGNILQRGFGHTPYGDRFRHTCGFEVVLPDGRLIHTGFGRFENAQAARVFPWGVGPWIDGLFTQSSLGIVTSACIWLLPRPEVIEGFAFKLDEENLGPVVDAVRHLRMNGTLRSTIHIANDLRVLSARMNYPWSRTNGEVPLPNDVRLQLRREAGLGAWNGLGGLYGTRTEVRAARRVVRRTLGRIVRVHFFDRGKVTLLLKATRWGSKFAPLASVQQAAKSALEVYDLLEGIPSTEHLKGMHWRSRPGSGRNAAAEDASDPRDAGLIWISPVLPMQGESAKTVVRGLSELLARYRFDPLITLASITDRALCCILSILYDRHDDFECEQADACAQEAHAFLRRQGYYSYRQSALPSSGNL